MKQTVTLDQFREAFKRAGRETQFSHEGLEALYDFLIEMEADTGDEWELDVIALCCDFAEATPEEIAEQYGIDVTEFESGDALLRDVVTDHLNNHSIVAGETESTIIYQAF